MTESEDHGAAGPQRLGQASQQVSQRLEQASQQVSQRLEQGFQQVTQSIDMRGSRPVTQPIGGQRGNQPAAESPDEPANESATERHREGQ